MKNPIIAFMLGFFPGGGLLYLGKLLRGLTYLLGEFFLIALTFFIMASGGGEIALLIVFVGIFLYIVNLVDTAMTASKLLHNKSAALDSNQVSASEMEYERFRTILLIVYSRCRAFPFRIDEPRDYIINRVSWTRGYGVICFSFNKSK